MQVLLEGIRSSAEMWDMMLLAKAALAIANLLQAKFFYYKYNKDHVDVLSHISCLTTMAEELMYIGAA